VVSNPFGGGYVESGVGRCGGPPWWDPMWHVQAAASTVEGVDVRQHRRLLGGVFLDT
jgi:hypothetical protein